ncbi:unnamed protein product [Periconia digitata]|uniref:Uncharacterized protein n=1 Tax=Periconia digitata TaxID=1303443 RepID=A0A9W4U9B8_9PLEO|nr:unnamed protein product [Periconia digitata]
MERETQHGSLAGHKRGNVKLRFFISLSWSFAANPATPPTCTPTAYLASYSGPSAETLEHVTRIRWPLT